MKGKRKLWIYYVTLGVCTGLLVCDFITGDNFALIITAAIGGLFGANAVEWYSQRTYSSMSYSGPPPSGPSDFGEPLPPRVDAPD